jgi:hypothetical protein
MDHNRFGSLPDNQRFAYGESSLEGEGPQRLPGGHWALDGNVGGTGPLPIGFLHPFCPIEGESASGMFSHPHIPYSLLRDLSGRG